jgi:hypothetical protein
MQEGFVIDESQSGSAGNAKSCSCGGLKVLELTNRNKMFQPDITPVVRGYATSMSDFSLRLYYFVFSFSSASLL